MICNKCGKELREDEKFCSNCGNQIINMQQNTNTNIQQMDNQNINKQVKGNKKNIIILIVSISIIAILIAVAIFIFLKKDKNESNNNNINDYEIDDIDTNDNRNQNIDTNTNDTIKINGHVFKKISGYNYIEKANAIRINDDKVAYQISVKSGSFNSLKSDLNLIKKLAQEKYSVNNIRTMLIGNREYIVLDVYDTINSKYYLLIYTSNDNQHIFTSVIYTRANNINYSYLYDLNKILDNVSYDRNSSNF